MVDEKFQQVNKGVSPSTWGLQNPWNRRYLEKHNVLPENTGEGSKKTFLGITKTFLGEIQKNIN